MNSPRLTESETSFSAIALPNRFVTASKPTATSSRFEIEACRATALSATLFNIQHLAEA
jgi:hypothetical protein